MLTKTMKTFPKTDEINNISKQELKERRNQHEIYRTHRTPPKYMTPSVWGYSAGVIYFGGVRWVR